MSSQKAPLGDAEKESRRASAVVPGEEGIKVAIRMRPMNNKESEGRRVWRVLQKYNSVTQTTTDGKPLPDRANGRTFFTFDKTFGEDATTAQVYNDVARGIVSSAVGGLNGTIFAYGQTSSGKTFTMLGGGMNEPDVPGVVQMAATDIFAHIGADPSRVFLLRVSFIEIYNEEVRDLLVSGTQHTGAVLAIREDPRRGVFVNANESIVGDLESLMSTLYTGEKNRSVGSTAMNERSSRSHTIFRITVESRKRKEAADEDDESSDDEDDSVSRRLTLSEEDDDGAVLVSTLNLVDLAGSESVRHTGATGERQKEGGKINQSLLTLSRVIASLGQPGSAHINFRDSKLTRILQPSLSGNARMAVICCATPSEYYLEETRSTLQFASRAKLVKTKPQVNEVLDDSSLIKRLQRELAEARKLAGGKENWHHIQELQTEAANAENAAKAADEKLRRLKSYFLRGGIMPTTLFKGPLDVISEQPNLMQEVSASSTREGKKRRRSDGIIEHSSTFESLQTTPKPRKPRKSDIGGHRPFVKSFDEFSIRQQNSESREEQKHTTELTTSEIVLLREALQAKALKNEDLKAEVSALSTKLESAKVELNSSFEKNLTLQSLHEAMQAQTATLVADKEFMQAELNAIANEHKRSIAETKERCETLLLNKDSELAILKEDNDSMKRRIKELEEIEKQLRLETTQNTAMIEETNILLDQKKTQCNELNALVDRQETDLFDAKEQVTILKNEITRLQQNNREIIDERTEEIARIQSELERVTASWEKSSSVASSLDAELIAAKSDILRLITDKAALEAEAEQLAETRDAAVADVETNAADTRLAMLRLENDIAKLTEEKSVVATALQGAQGTISDLQLTLTRMENAHDAAIVRLQESMHEQVTSRDNEIAERDGTIEDLVADIKRIKQQTDEEVWRSALVIEEKSKECSELSALNDELKREVESMQNRMSAMQNEVTSLQSEVLRYEEPSTTTADEVKCEIDQVKLEREETAVSANILAKKLEAARLQISDLSNEKARLDLKTKHLDELRQATVALFEATMAEKSRKNGELEESLKSMQEQVASRDDSIAKKDLAIAELDADIEHVKHQKEELEVAMVALQQKLESADARVEELERTLIKDSTTVEKTEAIARIQAELVRVTVAWEESRAVISTLDKELSTAKSDNERLTLDKGTLQAKMEQLAEALDAAVADAETTAGVVLEKSIISKELQNAQATISDLQLKQALLQTAHDEAIAGLQESVKLMQEQVASRDAMIAERDRAAAELAADIENIKQQKGELEVATFDLQQKLETSEVRVVKLEAERALIESRAADSIGRLQATVTEKTEEVARIQSELEQVTTSWKQTNSVVSELSMELSTARSDVERLAADKAALEAEIHQLAEARDAAVADAEANADGAHQTIERLENELTRVSEEKSAIETELQRSQAVISDLELTVTRLDAARDAAVADLRESAKLMQEQVASRDDVIAERDRTIADVVADIERIKQQKEELEAVMFDLQQKLKTSDSRVEELEVERNRIEGSSVDRISHLEAAVAEKTEEIARMKSELELILESLEQSSGAVSELNTELSMAKSSIARLTSDKGALEAEMEQLLNARDAAVADALNTRQTTVELVADIENIKQQKGELEAATFDLRQKLETSDIRVVELEAQKALIESSAADSIGRLEAAVIEKTEEIARVQSELERITASLEQTNGVISELSMELSTARSDNERLASENAALNVEVEQLAEDLDEAVTDAADTRRTIERLENELTRVAEEKSAVATELHDALATISNFKCNENILQTAHDEAIAGLQESVKSMQEQVASRDDTIAERDRAIAALAADIENIKQQKGELEVAMFDLQQKLETSDAHVVELEADRALIESSSADSIGHLQATVTEKTEEVARMQSELERMTASLEQTNGVLSELSMELSAARSDNEGLTSKNTALNAEVEQLAEALDAAVAGAADTSRTIERLENELTRVAGEKSAVVTELHDALATISNFKCNENILQTAHDEEVAGLRESVKSMQEQVASRDDTIAERDRALAELAAGIENIKQQKGELEAATFDLQQKLETSEVRVVELEAERALIESRAADSIGRLEAAVIEKTEEIARIQSELVRMTASLEQTNGVISASSMELSASRSENERLTSENAALNAEVKQMADALDAAVAGAADTRQTIERLQNELTRVAGEKCTVATELHDALATISDLQLKQALLQTAHNEAIAGLQESVKSMQEQGASRDAMIAERDRALAELAAGIENIKQQKGELEVATFDLRQKLETSEVRVVKLEAERALIEIRAADSIGLLQAAVIEKTEEVARIQSELEQVTTSWKQTNSDFSELSMELSTARSDVERLAADKAALEAEIHQLAEARDAAVADAEANADGAHQTIERLENELTRVSEEKIAIETELQRSQAVISDLELTVTRLDAARDAAVADLRESATLMQEQVASRDDVIAERDRTIADAVADIERIKQQKGELEFKVAGLRQVLLSSQSKLSDLPAGCSTSITCEKDQICELEKLLAHVLNNFSEARDAAISFEEELELKENELKEARRLFVEQQQLAESLLLKVGESDRCGDRGSAYEELMQDLELLMEEKLEVQERLEKELRDREASEDELRRLMGEEQRLLVNEAESTMQKYRDQLADYRESLSRVEEDNRLLRQEIEHLHHDRDRLKTGSVELQGTVDLFQQQVEDLNSQTSTLERRLSEALAESKVSKEQLNRLASEFGEYKKQSLLSKQDIIEQREKSNAQLQHDIATLHRKLVAVESEKDSFQNEVITLQDHVRHLKAQVHAAKQSASREAVNSISVLRDQLTEAERSLARAQLEACTSAQMFENLENRHAELERQYKVTKEEANSLKTKCDQMEIRLMSRLQESINKENENVGLADSTEVRNLRREIAGLREEIKSKDSRIRKLDSAKMTKVQCAALKRMKDERIQFMNEARDLRVKLKEAETELQTLRFEVPSKESSSVDQSTITELQEAKEALGTKLRKYAAHMKQMDQERSLAFLAMKKVVDKLDEDDLVSSVALLCDKLSAAEEECDALSQVEGRAAGFLLETEKLRDNNGVLQKQLSETESRLNELLATKQDLQVKLEESSRAIASLQRDRDELSVKERLARGSASEIESEKSRQIGYLEKENLQLMLELKNVKKEAQDLKLQIDSLRSGSQEMTEDLGGISSEVIAAKVVWDKENLSHSNSNNGQGVNGNGMAPGDKKPVAQKTRLSNNSRHKSTLGQVNVDEDTTGECKQS